MFIVYVVRNTNGKIYIGQTQDLVKRLKRHNGELPTKLTSFTRRNKGVWTIVYKQDVKTRFEALQREKYLKSHVGRDWLKSIIGSVAQR